jgi:hypothetical protein
MAEGQTIKNYQKKQVYINKAREAEKKYGLPDNLLVGLLAQESGHFDPKVISGERKSYAGAIGIGQFMPRTAKDYGIDPLNVDQAIDASAKYLSKSYKNLGNWDDAILSYNAGEGRVREYRAGKPIKLKEHQEYVGRVKNQIQTYSGVKPTFSKDVAPYMNMQSNNISILPETEINTTFAIPQVEIDYLNQLEQQTQVPQQTEITSQEDTFMQDLLAEISKGVEYVKPVQRDIMQSGGKIPVSPYGVYEFPRQEVLVPTKNGEITMKNVDYPILGTDEYGNSQMMYPNKNYKFQGNLIHEQPQ